LLLDLWVGRLNSNLYVGNEKAKKRVELGLEQALINKLSTDSIPQALLSLYFQILNKQVTTVILISTITSIFSLARNTNAITYNPLKLLKRACNQNRGYISSSLFEDIFELFDIFVELIARFCIFGIFAYVTDPWGMWIYISVIGLAYLIYCSSHPNGRIYHFFAGFFLVAFYSKGEPFYHSVVDYDMKNDWTNRILIWDYKYLLFWRVYLILTNIVLLAFCLPNLSYIEANGFGIIVFYLGLGCLAYTLVLNYLFDSFKIFKLQNRSAQKLIQNRALKSDRHGKNLNLCFRECDFVNDQIFDFLFEISNLNAYSNFTIDLSGTLAASFRLKKDNTSIQGLEIMYNKCIELNLKQFSDLKKAKGLKTLKLYCTDNNLENYDEFKGFADTIKNLKSLRALTLDFTNSQMPDQSLNLIVNSIGDLTLLEVLDLNFHNNFALSGLNCLSTTLQKLSQLQSLDLQLIYTKEMTTEEVIEFANSLSRLTQLTRLNLKFFSEYERENIGINEILISISKLKSLTNLTLKTNLNDTNTKSTEVVAESLANALMMLQNISELEINFEYFKALNESRFYLISKSLGTLSFLTTLSLSFKENETLTDNSLVKLGENLKKLITLQTLEIDFTNCIAYVTMIGMKQLISQSGGGGGTKLLTKFSLNITNAQKIGQNISGFVTKIEQLVQLRTLTLNFSQTPALDASALTILAQALGKLQKLTYLNISLEKCEHISILGLNSLFSQIKNLSDLNTFSLDLSEGIRSQKNANNNNFSNIFSDLKTMKSLSNLRLCFKGCKGISEENGKLNFLNEFRGLSFILVNSLEVDFSATEIMGTEINSLIEYFSKINTLIVKCNACNNILDDEIIEIGINLEHHASIKHLELEFMNCSKISNKGYKSLVTAVSHMESLKRISLNFRRCERINVRNYIRNF
jgi:hypothetical protein